MKELLKESKPATNGRARIHVTTSHLNFIREFNELQSGNLPVPDIETRS